VSPISSISSRARDALLAAGYQRHREALVGEAPGDRRPEARTDAENRRYPTVQVVLLSRVAQALPLGNSNSARDPGYISIE
jgi:hypothetical protein